MATSKLTPFDGKLDDEQPASALTPFTGQLDGEKPRTRGLFEAVNDNVIEFANAAAGGVSALANFVKPGNAVSGFIDENIIKAGEAKQSDVVQGAKRQLSEGLQNAQGIGDEVGAVGRYVLDNPLLAASQAAGSFALPGGAVKGAGSAAKALGAGAKGIETAGRVGGIAAGAAMAGGDAAGTAYDLASKAGATEDQALAAGRQASVIPALVGGVTGAFGAERLLAGAKGFGGNALSRGLKSGLSEAGQEALEEGVTQFEGQRAAMPYDESIDPTKGVAGAAAMGGIMGFGPGAVLGAMGGGPELPSKQMGIDPNAGPLSRAAASAVDSQPVPQPLGASITGTAPADLMGRAADPLAVQIAEGRQQSEDRSGVQVSPAAAYEPVPLEQRSLDELRQAFRSAQDPAIRKTLAAEIRKRREAMPDPLAPIQPQQETSLEPQASQAVQSQPQEAQAPAEPAVLGQPLTDTGTNMLGRGADPLQSIIQGQADARRAADELRGTTGASTVTGGDITPPSVESPLADVRSGGRNDDAGTAQPDANGVAGRGVGSAAQGSAALNLKEWSERESAPVGSWVKADYKLQDSQPIYQVQELDPKSLFLPELDEKGRLQPEKRKYLAPYTDRAKAGEKPPSITVIEMEDGRLRVVDGNRRVMAAIEAGSKSIRALVSTLVNTPGGKKEASVETLATISPAKGSTSGPPSQDGSSSRPDNWRGNAIKAGKVARSLGLDPKGKRLKEIVAEIDAVDAGSNVQNTPQGTAGEAKASPVEARAPEGGNAAADTGVPAAPGAGDVQADGVKEEAKKDAAPAVQTERYEAGKALTKEQRKTVLASLVDVYKQKGADREMKGVDQNGNERFGYVHSPDLFEKSDITGSMVRYYVTLPDGRKAHPTELFPEYTQSDIDAEMQRREQEERNKKSADESRLRVLKSRIADSLGDANRIFNKQNPKRDYIPATLTNGTQFVRTAPETAERDAEFLGDGWRVQAPASQAEKPSEQVNPEPSKEAQPKAEKPAEDETALNDRDTFTLNRLNRETNEMEPVTFKRGEYVRYTISGKELFGEIDGISQAKREFSVEGLWYPMGYAYKAERPAKKEQPTEKLAKVIEKVNAKNGEGLTDADRVPDQKPASKTPTIDRSMAVMDAVRAGTGSLDDYKASFASLESSEEAVKAELNAKTKDELLKAGGPYFYMRFKNETKPEIIRVFYKDLLNEYALGKSYGSSGFVMSSGGFAASEKRQHEALKALVEAQTEEDLKTFAAEVAARREEVKAKREAKKAAMENPQTLEDFRAVMREHITDGKTRKEAFLMLTPEQRVKYDELEAETTKESRETRKRERKTEVRAADQSTGGQIIATKHTRSGYDLFVVQLSDRLSKDDYNTVLASAKKLGGWYSSFRGNGAVPGFQFKEKPNAEAFLKLAGGDTTDAQAQVEQRRDAFEDDRSQTAVERLRTMADKLEEQASDIEGADRKTNTARRAKFASRALAGAAEMKAKAKTMRNVAQSIEDGKAKFLDGIRTKTQVDMLSGMVATAKNNELRAKYESYAEQEKRKGEPPTAETADFAEFPAFTAYRSDLASLARQMLEVEGTKKLGQQLMKIADDVSDAYIEFAKQPGNLAQLSTFSIRRGDEVKTAIFPSKDLAERAIKRSGLTGKAIVLAEKRGVNRIIMSPSEAINAGIWTGDGDKRITLTADAGNTLVEAIGRRGNKRNGLAVPWQFQTAHDRLKALARMGIETPAEFRSALREFIGQKEQATSNKVRELELAMAGKKNDGLDFFPTPAEVADQMVEAADLTPEMDVLEPSGGMGHIADRIRDAGAEPDVVEMAEDRRELLTEKGYELVGRDFLDLSGKLYDRIVMNPPFSNRRDAEHVQHAYKLLKPGGRIVAIMGEGVFFGKDKKAQDFRDWLDSVGGTDEKLPAGSFMAPSLPVNTGVNARMVVIEKPAGDAATQDDGDAFMGDKAKSKRQGTPVDRAIMDMAGEGREANEILSFIAKSSKSPYRRQLAQKLLATGANPAVSLGGEMGGGAGFRFLAKYSRKNHEVTLSEAAADRAEQIFLHETTHAATLLALDKGGLIATQMRRLAASVYKDASPEMRKMYGLVLDKRTGEVNVGEFVAEAFTNPDFQKALKGMKADNGSLWDRLVNIVRRILGMEPKEQDALSAALDLGAKVMRENMPLRAARSFRAEDGPAFAGADQTDTPEFKRWFAGSKVVDSAGKPLVMYHGTGADFSKFDITKFGKTDGGWAGKGFYFSPWTVEAGWYSKGESANIMPVYLSINNPLEWKVGTEGGRKLRDKKRELGSDGFSKWAQDHGYDGIHMTSPDIGSTRGQDEWVAFRPEQIKSAIGNNGNFDPDDADIAHFGIADAVEQIKAFDVKSAPKSAWAHYRGMALQALGRRQLVDLYGDEFGTHLHEYDTLVQKMDAEKNETGAEADDIAQRWGKLKDEKALAELMHDATLAKMDPDKPMPAGYSKAEYDRLKTRFNTLSPEAKTLYREARDIYVAHYKAVQQAIKDRIERSEMSPSEKKRMMAQLDDKLFKELQGVYFPLARFGQYVIVVKDVNGEVKNVTRAETVKEAEQARKELQKAFPAHMGNTVGKVLKQAEFNAGRDAVGKGFMADLMNALDEKGVDDELRDTVAQLYLSSLPDLSWAKHGIHRKGTPGFSQDARRAFAQNAFHGARYLAKLRYSDRLQDELTGMQEYVKAFEGVEEYDSIQGQQVVDEMVKRHEILMNPKSSPVSTALTSFGFLFHMGLSPASAMVNLTQTALVAYPQMGAKWGFGKAGAALTKASEEVVRAKNDLSKSLKGAELAAFERAVRDGTIDVTMSHDLAGIAQGEDQGVMWKIRPVMRWASAMFHHAEKFNRQATFLAAYRLSKETNQGRSEDWHYEEAKKATYDGHFDYSAANRARIMQGNWQRVILLFKQYSQSMIYTLARNAYQSVKAIDPKERAQARKTLGGILAAHAAAAGVLGLPIVGPLLTVASWIGGDDDDPWDSEIAMQNAMAEMIGPKAAEVVARGFSRLTPFDLSGRVALNKLILPDVQEGLEGKEWAESAMAAALGPVAGIGVNMARGAQKITEGDYLRGLEDMMPTALRGPLKALRYANEGAVDKTGIVITDEVGAAGVLGQASGFSPSQVRRDTERRSAIYAYERALLERRSVLMRMMTEARIQGDTETAAEVQKDIQRFNEKNPNRRITPMNIAQSVRKRRKRIEEAEQGVYLPKKHRDAMEAVSF